MIQEEAADKMQRRLGEVFLVRRVLLRVGERLHKQVRLLAVLGLTCTLLMRTRSDCFRS